MLALTHANTVEFLDYKYAKSLSPRRCNLHKLTFYIRCFLTLRAFTVWISYGMVANPYYLEKKLSKS